MEPLPIPQQSMLAQMRRPIETFSERTKDRSTLNELHRMVINENSRSQAHDLFDKIRRKTLAADNRNDAESIDQYCFEEACAKTLFNLTDTDAPFDYGSSYWVVPHALALARRLGICETDIVGIVAA